MNFRLGDSSIVEKLTIDQLKEYWHELKMSRFESHFYLKLLDKVKLLNPNLVLPAEEEIEKLKNEAISISMWEENWDIKNQERVKKGGTDYSLFHQRDKIRDLNENSGLAMTVNQ